jgi:hypothetical protein
LLAHNRRRQENPDLKALRFAAAAGAASYPQVSSFVKLALSYYTKIKQQNNRTETAKKKTLHSIFLKFKKNKYISFTLCD